MTDNRKIAIRHFTLSDNFLQLVESILNETIESGNTDFYMGPPREDITEHYRQMTKWSDFRIIIPTMFNFFHGIELQLKAANYLINLPTGKPNHKLPELFIEFKKNYPTASELTKIFDRYIYPTSSECKMLHDFYLLNNISDSGQFFEVFKYPYSKDFNEDFNYMDLRNLGNDGITFFKQVIADINIIRTKNQTL